MKTFLMPEIGKVVKIMITKPTLLLDENRCRKNIGEMFFKAKRNNVEFRPHFKTHQSLEIGKWFKELGVNKITVSSFEMAKYFAEDWNDITVAFPVNILEIDKINELASKIQLTLLIESKETADFLTQNLKHIVKYFIKIDVGYHRTGLPPNDLKTINEIITTTQNSSILQFQGFLTHAGQTYNCRKTEEILEIHKQCIDLLTPLKNLYKKTYPEMLISIGDTPSCSIVEDFSMFDEIRPGNFVFYDLSQNQIGSCRLDQIAVALACPIVSIHQNRNEIVIYGGGVHFSKDRLEDDLYGTIYGKVVENNGNSWGELIPGTYLKNLSQEHGIVKVPEQKISNYNIGDILLILPVHSCMTADILKSYQTTTSKIIERL